MNYTARNNDVEAAFVSLAGASLAVVAIDGKAHAMPADVFLSLYEERQETPEPEPESPRARAEKVLVKMAMTRKRGTKTVDGHPSQQQADMYRLLAEYGPLTTHEVMARTKAEYGATNFILNTMRKRGTAARIEHNGLDKWQAVVQP